MPGYNIWTEHGEQFVSEPLLEHEHDNQTADGLDEMLADFGDAMHSVEEEPTADAKAFYDMLAASKERLHSFTSVAQLTAVARLMAIKSQYNLSAECINKLLSPQHNIIMTYIIYHQICRVWLCTVACL